MVEDLKFKKLEADDLPFLNEVRNECAEKYLHDSRKFTIDQTVEWFYRTEPNYYIILLGEDKIGYFRLTNYSEVNKNIYIGADLRADVRSKKLGFLAYSKFIPYLFESLNLNKITLEVLSTNEIAIKLYRKLGFTIEGVKRQEVLKNGIFVDSIIMSLLKSEL